MKHADRTSLLAKTANAYKNGGFAIWITIAVTVQMRKIARLSIVSPVSNSNVPKTFAYLLNGDATASTIALMEKMNR